MAFWSLACAFVGLGFAVEAGGFLAHGLNAALAAFLLLLGAVLGGSGPKGPWRSVACGAGILLLPADPSIRPFAAALWLWGLSIEAMALGCVLFGAFCLCVDRSLLAWHAQRAVSYAVSGLAGRCAGRPLSLGPSFSGIDAAALSLCLGTAAWRFSPRRRAAGAAAFAASVAAAWLAFLLLFAAWPAWLPSVLFPLHVPMAALLLLAAPTAGFVLRWTRGEERGGERPAEARPVGRLLAASVASAALGVWCLTAFPAAQRPGTVRVGLYEKGFLNWLSPDKETYGGGGVGMFGNLPRLVAAMGWESAFVREITPEALAGLDVLVLANPEEPLSAASLAAVDGFVRGGGGLLALGDHTWRKSGRPLLDDPLEWTAIRFAFDSADPFVGGWLHSHRLRPHPISAGLTDAVNEAGSVVGASLAISYPAAPLVVGRFGYSDPGDPANAARGYLGSLDFEPGERLGDVVLSAAQTVGRGRVVAVGDTSGFANGVLVHSWPFATRVLRWLASDGKAALPPWREALGLLLLAAAAAALMLPAARAPAAVPLLSAVLLLSGWASRAAVAELSRPPPLKGPVAVVDLSHGGRLSLEGWRDDGILGVSLNLMREGYLAIGARTFDRGQARESAVWTIVSPTRPYAPDEIDLLASRVREGMTLVVAAGWEDRAAACGLLDRFGLSVSPVPLGPGFVRLAGAAEASQVHFREAWPVEPARGKGTEGIEPIAFLSERAVAVRKRVGRGQLILIADATFLTAQNFEGEHSFARANVELFQALVRARREGSGR